MNISFFNIENFSEHEKRQLARNEIDLMLHGKFCSICGGPFIGRKEKDNVYCSGTNPLTYAHDYCWRKNNEQN